MIVRITGTVIDVGEDCVVIDRDGMAWEVLVPAFGLGELAALRGREATLHTIQIFEGNQASGHLTPRLLGFLHADDKRFFMRFTGVKGIGSRKALKALAQPVRRVASWIREGDVKSLSTLPGIGKRAAEMMVATLREKMDEFALGSAGDRATLVAPMPSAQRDALEVMIAWGDSRADAEQWLERASQLHPDLDAPDEWIRAAYRIKTGAE